jgi:diketogulonate reductase-like aldo/keto reductase
MTFHTVSGKELHPIGIGTWLIGGSWSPGKGHELWRGSAPAYGNEVAEAEAIRYAIEHGQNHIDNAELYGVGHTEEVVGEAIKGLPREDLFLASKLWHTHVAPGTVRPAVEAMLQRLGTNYLDLLYIHSSWEGWQDAVPQIDELINEGVVRHFGVSNFTLELMEEAAGLTMHRLAANQMNYNVLYKAEVDDAFLAYCREQDVQIVAYQPIKRTEVLASPAVQRIAEAHAATPAQVALAWLLRQGALPIPKSVSKKHIDENRKAADLHLSDADMETLNLASGWAGR